MIGIRSREEQAIMRKGGKILADVLSEVLKHVKEGTSELEIDALAEKLIREKGGEPGFKRVPGYAHTVCMATNDVVVHGVPSDYRFAEGDIVCVDCGVYYAGFHTDMAETILVQNQESRIKNYEEKKKFLDIGKKALEEAIAKATVGNRVGHISKTIQTIVEGQGYSVVRSLVGHGVGRELHEEPEVPGVLFDDIKKTPYLMDGMTIAIEVIYTMGKPDVVYAGVDDWTIKTKDGSLSAVFERTVLVTKDGPEVLTA